MGQIKKTQNLPMALILLLDREGMITGIKGDFFFPGEKKWETGKPVFSYPFFENCKEIKQAISTALSGQSCVFYWNDCHLFGSHYADITLTSDHNLSGNAIVIFQMIVRELNEAEKIRIEMQQMDEIIRQINSTLQMDEVLDIVFRQLKDFFSFDGMCIQLLDENKKVKTMKIFHEGVGEDDLKEMENLEYPLEQADEAIKKVLEEGNTLVDGNTLFVPLTVHNEKIGILSVSYFEKGFSLDDAGINSIRRYAEYISIALNNSRLYRAIEKINTALKEKDLMISADLLLAERIQSRLFVHSTTDIEGVRLHVDYLPFIEVGGDFYDITQMDSPAKKIRIFIADATGHGIPAGLITMLLKSEYEKIKRDIESPSQTLEKFNKDYCKNYAELGVYCTAFIADLDMENYTMTYSSAGHPQQILISGDTIHKITTKGSLIGFFDSIDFHENTIPFKKGDKILLYTDGIFEEFNNECEIYGEERMFECFYQHRKESPEEIKRAILEDVRNFIGKKGFEDDVTFIGAIIE